MRWLGAAVGLLMAAASVVAAPPNVVVFIADDHGFLDSSLAD